MGGPEPVRRDAGHHVAAPIGAGNSVVIADVVEALPQLHDVGGLHGGFAGDDGIIRPCGRKHGDGGVRRIGNAGGIRIGDGDGFNARAHGRLAPQHHLGGLHGRLLPHDVGRRGVDDERFLQRVGAQGAQDAGPRIVHRAGMAGAEGGRRGALQRHGAGGGCGQGGIVVVIRGQGLDLVVPGIADGIIVIQPGPRIHAHGRHPGVGAVAGAGAPDLVAGNGIFVAGLGGVPGHLDAAVIMDIRRRGDGGGRETGGLAGVPDFQGDGGTGLDVECAVLIWIKIRFNGHIVQGVDIRPRCAGMSTTAADCDGVCFPIIGWFVINHTRVIFIPEPIPQDGGACPPLADPGPENIGARLPIHRIDFQRDTGRDGPVQDLIIGDRQVLGGHVEIIPIPPVGVIFHGAGVFEDAIVCHGLTPYWYTLPI